jgi:DNA-cytosine methyltransferase
MNVLSLFDGMSGGQIALNRAGIKYDKYFASEIDKYAIEVTQHNYPETIQIGDVLNVKGSDLPKIDLIIGGSPCQGFSFAGKRLNFEDPRSKLFFEFVRLRDELKPKYFLLENVKMKKEHEQVITEHMGVEPIRINSNLVSAQNRERLYWTNIPGIEQPEDKGILVKDIIDYSGEHKILPPKTIQAQLYYAKNYKATGKAPTLTRELAHGWGKNITPKCYLEIKAITGEDRLFSPLECERLQTVPDNYSSIVSNTQRFNMLGNGWTVDVITHIFKNISQKVLVD